MKVLLAQPVHQHAYETAVALLSHELLGEFHTGLFFKPSVLARLPSSMGKGLSRRSHPGLEAATIRLHPYVAGSLLTRRLPGDNGTHEQIQRWLFARFDEQVARCVTPGNAVHVFEGTGLCTLKAAAAIGCVSVLEVPNVSPLDHWRQAGGHLGALAARLQSERELAHWLLAPSARVVEDLIAHGVPRAKVVLLPYGVDTHRFSRPRPAFTTEGPLRLLFVGNDRIRKGFPDLLAALRSLKSGRALELTVVGGTSKRSTELLATKGEPIPISFVGSVPKSDVHNFFTTHDVFLLPTHAEGSALVVYEAMAAGMLVITTPAAGSVVEGGESGILVAPGDRSALASALDLAINYQAAAKRMAARGMEVVRSEFSWVHYGERLASFYGDL